MGTKSKAEYLQTIRPRYRSATKREKMRILDKFCMTCGYNRKYAIRILNSSKPVNASVNLSRRGRNKIYDHKLISMVLTDVWTATNLPCSKRLKAILPLWLPFYDKNQLPENIYKKLLAISPSTIDRLMASYRSKFCKHGLATTKPGSLLKKHIPIKTSQWDKNKP